MFEESISEILYKFFYDPKEIYINDKTPHDDGIVQQIRFAYVFGLIGWLAIVIMLKLYDTDTVGMILLLIPFLVFLLGYYNANIVTPEVEKEMFTTNYLSVGLIVILPLLVWITDVQSKNKSKFIALLVLAIILTLLSMIDVWVSKREMSVYHHIRSMLQTLSIVIIIYALYIFYLEKYNHINTSSMKDRRDDTHMPYSDLETAAILATGAAAVDISTAAAISNLNS